MMVSGWREPPVGVETHLFPIQPLLMTPAAQTTPTFQPLTGLGEPPPIDEDHSLTSVLGSPLDESFHHLMAVPSSGLIAQIAVLI